MPFHLHLLYVHIYFRFILVWFGETSTSRGLKCKLYIVRVKCCSFIMFYNVLFRVYGLIWLNQLLQHETTHRWRFLKSLHQSSVCLVWIPVLFSIPPLPSCSPPLHQVGQLMWDGNTSPASSLPPASLRGMGNQLRTQHRGGVSGIILPESLNPKRCATRFRER